MHRRRAALERQRQTRAKAQTLRVDDNRTRWLLWASLLAMLLLAMLASSAARADEGPVRVSVPTAPVKIKAGQTVAVPIQVKIARGWHIFGAKPLVDGVRPAAITLKGAGGVGVVPISLPAAKKMHVEPLQADANVYESTVQVEIKLKADPKAAAGACTLDGQFAFQACSDRQCMLPRKVSFKIPVTVVK